MGSDSISCRWVLVIFIILVSEQDAIELIKTDTTWSISGNDTLQIKRNLIKNLFSNLKKIKKEHLVTSKKDNWINYGVTQENGTHVALINGQGETEAYYVFGKSIIYQLFHIFYGI